MESLDVLVVDDELGIRMGIVRILKNFTVSYPFLDDDIQYNLVEVATGEKALKIIENNPPAIILLDNKLPGIQGVEVLEHINKNQLDILVIMITSYASLDLAVKATNMGAFDFVPKPFTPQELKASMENVTKHYFLKRMTKKLHKEGKQVRFQFLNVLSHELRSPLNDIYNNLKVLKEHREDSSKEDYNRIIDDSMSRIRAMRSLLVDLLDLTRIESGKNNREFREIDLGLVAKSSIDTMMPMAIQRGVTIKFNESASAPYFSDSEEMEIVFNNLLSNAIKYNIDGGNVTCNIESAVSEIIIEVTDTGIGIANEDIPNLFQEFSRIRNTMTKDVSGSGLGLSIVKRIVDLYNGRIDVRSKIGEGTTFVVYLPVSKAGKQNMPTEMSG